MTFAEAPRTVTALRAGTRRCACRSHRTMHPMTASRGIIFRRTAIPITVAIMLASVRCCRHQQRGQRKDSNQKPHGLSPLFARDRLSSIFRISAL